MPYIFFSVLVILLGSFLRPSFVLATEQGCEAASAKKKPATQQVQSLVDEITRVIEDFKKSARAPNMASRGPRARSSEYVPRYRGEYAQSLAIDQDANPATALQELLDAFKRKLLETEGSPGRRTIVVYGAEYVLRTLVSNLSLSLPEAVPARAQAEITLAVGEADDSSFEIITQLRKAGLIEVPEDKIRDDSGPRVYGVKLDYFLKLKEHLAPRTRDLIKGELPLWPASADQKKVRFAFELNKFLIELIEAHDKGESLERLESLLAVGIIDANYRNLSDLSIFQYAVYYDNMPFIDWFIDNQAFDFNAKNKQGYTEVEQLRLRGKTEIADKVIKRRPEVQAREFPIRSKQPNGAPIIDFIQFSPGRFISGNRRDYLRLVPKGSPSPAQVYYSVSQDKSVVGEISKAFEMMSIPVTRNLWNEVIALAREADLPGTPAIPGSFTFLPRDQKFYPASSLNPRDMIDWIRLLQEISLYGNKGAQSKLEKLFPGHEKGATYRIPTIKEWEYSMRLGGLATGDFPYGHDLDNPETFAIPRGVRPGVVHSVGLTPPVFIDGKPVYNLTSLVKVYAGELPPTGKLYIVGHGYLERIQSHKTHLGLPSDETPLSEDRKKTPNEPPMEDRGLRIIRTKP